MSPVQGNFSPVSKSSRWGHGSSQRWPTQPQAPIHSKIAAAIGRRAGQECLSSISRGCLGLPGVRVTWLLPGFANGQKTNGAVEDPPAHIDDLHVVEAGVEAYPGGRFINAYGRLFGEQPLGLLHDDV
jgi:hypothetical protein